MKITGWHVDGFGVFRDQTISGLDRNLVIIYGSNEAGKSTLLGFIRAMLFGFPRANSRDISYPPLAGGVLGGRVDLLTRAGEAYSVFRKPGPGGGTVTVNGNDGALYDKSMLDRLLGGVSYEAFRNIMAFGLSELSSIETLSGEHIASAIYGAGLGASMTAMPTALKTIRERKEKLFRKKGKQPLNLLADDLDRVRKSLQVASLESGRYDTVSDAFARAEQSVAGYHDRLILARRELQRYETMERLWEDWVIFRATDRELTALEIPAVPFPENGLLSLERLIETRDRSGSGLSGITLQLRQISDRLSLLPVNEKILAQAGAIGYLLENRTAYAEKIRRQPLLMRERQDLEDTLARLLQRLGGGWNESAVLGFDLSLFTRDVIRQHQAALDGLDRELAAAETLLSDKKTAADSAAEALLQAEKEAAGKGDLPPERDMDLVRKLKQGQDRFADTMTACEQASSALEAAKKDLSLLEEAADQRQLGVWPAVVVLGIGGVVTGWVAYSGRYREAALVFGCALTAAGGVWSYCRQRQLAIRYHQDRVRQQRARVGELEVRTGQLESVRDAYMHLGMEVLGLGDPVRGEDLLREVDRFMSQLSQEEKQREAILLARSRQQDKKLLAESALKSFEKMLAARHAWTERISEEKTVWENRCLDLGLSASLSPATALEALDAVEQAVEAIQKRDRCASELSRLNQDLAAYQRKAEEVATSIGWNAPEEDVLPAAVSELAALLEESKGNEREKKTLAHQQANLVKDLASEEEKLRETEACLQNLLDAAGAADEASFRQLGRSDQRRRQLHAAVETAEGNLRRISGEEELSLLKTTLASLSPADIKAGRESADREVQSLDGELSRGYALRAELKQALETLSASEDIVRLRAEEAKILADMEENAAQWSRYALADFLIQQAREVFEKKHQPAIIQDAGRFFRQMTGERYAGIVSPLGENALHAISHRGERISPEALSRGTAEQLYLSVRFGFIRHQAGSTEPLPVIMDDILVNFDPVRAAGAAEAVRELTSSHQVLYFTCHPETVALFQAMDREIPVFRLSEGRIVGPEKAEDSRQSAVGSRQMEVGGQRAEVGGWHGKQGEAL